MTTGPNAGESLNEFAIRLVDDWADAMAGYLERALPVVNEAVRLMEDPQVRAALAARQFGDAVREYRPCHCLCGWAHRAKGVCDASAVTTRHYDTEALGPVDVPLCGPCAAAQGIAVPASGKPPALNVTRDRHCGHCGRDNATASAYETPLCHTDDPALPDCYRRVTVYSEPIGALLGDGLKPAGVEGIIG